MITTFRTWMALLVTALVAVGCGGSGDDDDSPAGSLDQVAPTIVQVTPANNANGVGTNKPLTINFSEPMLASSLRAAITLTDASSGAAVALKAVTFNSTDTIATLAPQAPLQAGRTYRAQVSTAAEDLAGNALASAYVWRFTTGGGSDTSAPTIATRAPASGATGVPINTSVAMSFSEAMDADSVENGFTLTGGGSTVAGELTYVGKAAVFIPTASLAPNTLYTAKLAKTAADTAGNGLAADVVWTFTTGASADTTPPVVVSVSPPNGATGVARDATVVVTFSEPVLPFNYGSINGVLIEVTIDYDANTVSLTPTGDLLANTTYTNRVNAKDLSGNQMTAPYFWAIQTGP